MRKKRYTTIIVLFIISACIALSSNRYGLTFKSHSVNQDERTTLLLTPDKGIDLTPGFSLDFDLQVWDADFAYGYIFRIIFDDLKSLDLTANMRVKKLNFVLADANNIIENLEFKDSAIIRDYQWMKVRIEVNRHSISCTVDGITQIVPYSLDKLNNVHISFGRNKHSVFHSTDVPPMTLRNVVIKNHAGKMLRKWELSKHNNKEVYDQIASARATIENGIWEIDRHRKWEKISSIPTTEINSQIAFDTILGRIFIATSDSLLTYHLADSNIDRVKIRQGKPFQAGGSQLIYNEQYDKLYSYSILYPEFVTYDRETHSWSEQLTEHLPPIQHHNRTIDYKNNRLLVFGGYGIHQYSAALAQHRFDSCGWKIDTLSCIYPRYLAAMAYWGDNKLLVMGGYGSISGKQEEFPQNYHDLYEINYQDLTCRKLADFPDTEISRVLGNSMVIDKNRNKIYTLAYNNDKFQSAIRIFSVDLTTMECSIMSDSILYHFLDIDSYCDLFYYAKTATLYAVVLQSRTQNISNIDVYSLAYPPLDIPDVLQRPPCNWMHFLLLSLFSGIPAIMLAGIIYFRRKTKKVQREEVVSVLKNMENFQEDKNKNLSSAILMFGGFQAFNKDGKDITRNFSVILKQLFLYILLSSLKNGKGVTSQKLDETFWFGMDKENAVNNRSVNIRKLRLLIAEIGNIVISHENSYWYLDMGDDIFCDYGKMMNLLKIAGQEARIDKQLLEEVIDLALAGTLLPNISTEWLDDYKDKCSSSLVDFLLKAATQTHIKEDLKLLLQLSEIILIHDSINEDAIRMKCKLLYQLGQKGLSKQSFDRFCTSYKNLLDTKPNFEYREIIQMAALK
jgi:two-component SAPR family response regulator